MWSMRARSGVFSDVYLRWRTATVYGDASAAVPPTDVVEFLMWRRRQRKLTS